MVRVWGFGDSFALLAMGQFGLLSPALSDGAEPVRMGSREAVEPPKKPCSWTTPPYPQSRPISLLATLWVGSRSSVYGHTTEPGAIHQEGDKSVRSCTLMRADVQDVCSQTKAGVNSPKWGRRVLPFQNQSLYPDPRKPHQFDLVGFSSFWGQIYR